MAQNYGKNEDSETKVSKTVKALSALLMVVITALLAALFNGSPLQATTCRSHEWIGNNIKFVCGDDFRRPTREEAEIVLIRYFSQVGGSTALSTYNSKLTDEFRQRIGMETFAESWSDTSWAEVVSAIERLPDRNNVYRIKVRRYTTNESSDIPRTGRIVIHNRDVGLRFRDGEWLVDSDIVKTRILDEKIVYARAELPEPHVTYIDAFINDNVALPLSQQLSSNGSLRVLCVLDEGLSEIVPFHNKDSEAVWYRTPQGWLPRSATSSTSKIDAPACDPRYSENGVLFHR